MAQHQADVQQAEAKIKNLSIKTENLRLYLVTWNVGAKGPPADLNDLLDLTMKPLPDIYAIGLQEMDLKDSDLAKNAWCSKLTDVLGALGYVRLKVVRMQAVSLQVFVKRDRLLHYTSVESEIAKAGLGGWWGNKGGVAVRFDLNGINLIIVNAHLAAHMNNVAERIEDCNAVLSLMKFRDPDVDNVLDHDYVFWMGDLNFRIENNSKSEVERLVNEGKLEKLLQSDQLKKCMEEDLLFVNFQEGPITFNPTYKFDPDTDLYDTSEKQRVPAWCDRILWMAHTDLKDIDLSVDQTKYESKPSCKESDHKPVVSLFKVTQKFYRSLTSYKLSDHKPVTSAFEFTTYSEPPNPMVTFTPIKKWSRRENQTVRYTVKSSIQPDTSGWDWIGLYKVEFKHLDDYVVYVWAVNDAEKKGPKGVTVEFKIQDSDIQPGKYVLCYVSNYKKWLRGMSDEFEIVP
ncbi:hypothetical protein CHS0354_007577 [Potamilus streckersoni]|uniref:Inositol polyphosphate-related phosphatase domain-containing protein n=1 Tax=Potamilus streckersoni TaxID=2493646 RepID=A0AAE0T3U3_9BIVA|nr:hypothetical protein CHS0354_007577 [Potamilus streckersoni]